MRTVIISALVLTLLPILWGAIRHVPTRAAAWPFIAISLVMLIVLATRHGHGWAKWLALIPIILNAIIIYAMNVVE